MTLYVPGTGETDPRKIIMSLQQIAARVDTPPCFKANKNGTDQTGVADTTFTQVTFGTEVYDVGGYFSSNTWTPPSGKVTLTAGMLLSGTITLGNQVAIAILKNGSGLAQQNSAARTNSGYGFVTCDDVANGTDAYTVSVYVDVDSGTATVSGSVSNTFFCGHWRSV